MNRKTLSDFTWTLLVLDGNQQMLVQGRCKICGDLVYVNNLLEPSISNHDCYGRRIVCEEKR